MDDTTPPIAGSAPSFRFSRRTRHVLQVVADAAAWAAALVLAELARFDFAVPDHRWPDLAVFVGIAVILAVPVGYAFGLYVGRYRYGTFDEVTALAKTISAVGLVLFLLALAAGRSVPASVPLAAAALAFVFCGGVRVAIRSAHERRLRPDPVDRKRLLVLGAGSGGIQVLEALLRQPDAEYVPVALLDDDPDKRRLRIMGVNVVGTRDDIARAAEEYRADAMLVAIPTAPAALLREVTITAAGVGLEVRVLPPVAELYGVVTLEDIRPPTETDLMGRQEIDIDVAGIAHYLRGRRVLVTGAGGSIGSELCRQIARFEPATLVMLDRDETALLGVQLSLDGAGRLDSPDLVVASVRDAARVREVFETHRPEVVFHAAALKHVPLLELNPREAFTTNVLGTGNLLEAAIATGVSRFVNISTDKAADAANVLGYTKRLAERLTAEAAGRASGIYLSVRFGNVLGSRGSVLETFRAQLAAGGPLTVTDPEVTRYLMTREEAIVLTIQAGAVGRSGEVLVLDLGEPVRILEIAQRVAESSDRAVDIVFTGLRPGEKLRETLFGAAEVATRPFHPLISHCDVPPITRASVEPLAAITTDPAMRNALAALCADDPLHTPSTR